MPAASETDVRAVGTDAHRSRDNMRIADTGGKATRLTAVTADTAVHDLSTLYSTLVALRNSKTFTVTALSERG